MKIDTDPCIHPEVVVPADHPVRIELAVSRMKAAGVPQDHIDQFEYEVHSAHPDEVEMVFRHWVTVE